MNLTSEIKRQIYDYIIGQPNYLGLYGVGNSYDNLNIVDFLKLIWDLPAMPSRDPRFKNAEADAYQHLINNNDWDDDETYLIRFNLLAGKEKFFVKFIEVIVSPAVRGTKEEIVTYVQVINNFLHPISCELAQADLINDLPCYRLMEGVEHDSIPHDLSPNLIPIYVDENCKSYPAFRLDEYTWDDYGYKTRYKLTYYTSADQYKSIGVVRIMKRDVDATYGAIPSGITELGADYCSLGQSLTYYSRIKLVLGPTYKNFLFAFRDAACFSQICDEFCNESAFNHSLLRETDADKALQMAKYVLAGYSATEKFDFVFKTKLPYYTDEDISIRFNFEQIEDLNNLNRVVALIGNNGVGKTTILSQLAECLVKNDEGRFMPHPPLFTKVIAASYSIFDKFFKIEGTSFNYVYCGIQKKNGSLMNDEEIESRRRLSLESIRKLGREKELNKFLKLLLNKELLKCLFSDEGYFDEDFYMSIRQQLSSGQSMIMNLVIEIVANIRRNSLLLLDEPEVHLHPKGITQIVNIVNHICDKYFSCCIMATHSSIVIQELLSRNVIILDREEDGSPTVRGMRVESLGENLTTITEDVFGRSSITPSYRHRVQEIVERNKTMGGVLHEIQNKDVPISMGLYMLIDKYLNIHD
jgi:ATPase components of ABC transporters with duplicated ATPase domains